MAWFANQDDLCEECVCAGLYAVGLTPAAVISKEVLVRRSVGPSTGQLSRKQVNQRSRNWNEGRVGLAI